MVSAIAQLQIFPLLGKCARKGACRSRSGPSAAGPAEVVARLLSSLLSHATSRDHADEG